MTLKNLLQRFTTPVSEIDLQRLKEFCAGQSSCAPIAEAKPREQVSLVGEVTSMRIVPRAGSPSLEVTVSDGSGSLVVVWTGRRRVAGVAPGKRLMISGRGAPQTTGGRLMFFNPRYELL